MPASPSWLRRVPDAIKRLEQWREPDLTRREVERLLGIRKTRAAVLMRQWGAVEGRLGRRDLLLPKESLLECFRALATDGRVEREEIRVRRVLSVLGEARIARVRLKAPTSGKTSLLGLPTGVTVEAGRIVVTFATAIEAGEKLLALAEVLRSNWQEFEECVRQESTEERREAGCDGARG